MDQVKSEIKRKQIEMKDKATQSKMNQLKKQK